jgi:hypothetical protein
MDREAIRRPSSYITLRTHQGAGSGGNASVLLVEEVVVGVVVAVVVLGMVVGGTVVDAGGAVVGVVDGA